MIHYVNDDLTNTSCKHIAHGVNCQGKMNSGVAKSIREKFPFAYESFIKDYEDGENILGSCTFVETKGKFIYNCYTQERYGYDKKVYADKQAVKDCLGYVIGSAFFLEETDENIKIAMPKIGCGRGGLSWETDVLPIVENLQERFPNIDFYIYDRKDEYSK